MSKSRLSAIAVTALAFAVPPADAASSAWRTLFESYQAIAKGDAVRGKAFFFVSREGGRPDSPSCVTCHTINLAGPGKTRAGKTIEPMAASVSPSRFTGKGEVEKWLRRNCSDVLDRECSAQEKSDILAFLLSI